MCLTLFKDNKLIRKFVFILFLIFTILLPLQVQSQTLNRTRAVTDTVHVSISNISISNEFSVRGLNANFPYPVISTISVVDNQGNTVPGLADTLHWLTADDIAQHGLPVSEIWSNFLEYHLDDPSIPTDPNLYNQIPSPLITEVRETMLLPTNTMLVMDASSSMLEEIEDVKAGARLFVNLMRSVDLSGIVQFAKNVNVIQPLTNDKDLLIAIINRAELKKGTSLYDGIMAAIQEIKGTAGRRGIIVYTDGRDNSSNFNSNAVIDSARVYRLPIFTIALGFQTSEQELQRIAAQTGGLFFKAATAQEMKLIYVRLSELIQNYYLMAHTSPDPNFNDTWRVVDVTINTPQFYGRGTGQYYVPGLPMP
ncbi:MAG: VWA domain-containing protein, partial [bacterium]